eukprot:CFRG1041T1
MSATSEKSNTTEAWVVPQKGADLELQTIEMLELTSTQVEVDISYVGLCHTDIHMRDNDWGISDYPLVLGHEGVGTVSHVGDRVQNLTVGDVVGIGWIRDSCATCKSCLAGKDNLCEAGYQGVYLAEHAGPWGKKPFNMGGCYAKKVRIEERFAFKIPNNLSPEKTAPIMCAGITVFEPIVDYVKPGTRVGVRSLGGLGQLAVQFALAVGAEVTCISRNDSKEKAMKQSGAHKYIASSNKKQMEGGAGTIDVLLDTCPVNSEDGDLSEWMNLLAYGGTYVRLGIPEAGAQSFKYDYIPLIFTAKKVVGSIVSGSKNTSAMLELASLKNIECDVEVVPFEEINSRMSNLKEGRNERSRYVLKF